MPSHVPVDLLGTGDYQAVERKFRLSRRMLQTSLELGFPISVVERSLLVLRDLDLLQAINAKTTAVVPFSIIHTPDWPHWQRITETKCLAPPRPKRFAAVAQVAKAGILTGTCIMPVLPQLCDNEANLPSVVKWTADHGGQSMMACDLTLADQQCDVFFGVLQERFLELLEHYRRLSPRAATDPRVATGATPRCACTSCASSTASRTA